MYLFVIEINLILISIVKSTVINRQYNQSKDDLKLNKIFHFKMSTYNSKQNHSSSFSKYHLSNSSYKTFSKKLSLTDYFTSSFNRSIDNQSTDQERSVIKLNKRYITDSEDYNNEIVFTQIVRPLVSDSSDDYLNEKLKDSNFEDPLFLTSFHPNSSNSSSVTFSLTSASAPSNSLYYVIYVCSILFFITLSILSLCCMKITSESMQSDTKDSG